MVEVSLNIVCVKCQKAFSRLLRFKTDEVLTDYKLIQRAMKATIRCKFCGYVMKYKNLPQENKRGFSNIQDKVVSYINKSELR